MAAVESQTPTNGENGQVDLSTIPISPTGASGEKESSADTEQVTVFHDKDNFNVKHPLMNKWTLWFTKPPSGKVCPEYVCRIDNRLHSQGDNWNDLLKEVITFNSVEEFWGVYVCFP